MFEPAYVIEVRSSKVFVFHCSALDLLQQLPNGAIDLVFTSPPYEAQRTYGVGFKLKGQAWVDWAVGHFVQCDRVCSGLNAWVVEGFTEKFKWSATPALMMADLHRMGIRLRKPPIYKRQGIPGGGGPDWWRNDYESIVCSSHGKLPWSDPKAIGHPPKCKPGGATTNRTKNGERCRDAPKKFEGRKHQDGVRGEKRGGSPRFRGVEKSNPGNVVQCTGGHLGSKLAHENEAPFPVKLAEAFVRCYCKPGGVVLDPFGGSGTTAAAAVRHGRNAVVCDLRLSQVELIRQRLIEEEDGIEMPAEGVFNVFAE